jgi:hypothetical protein
MRRLYVIGYFGSWLVTAALLFFVLVAWLWEVGDVSRLTGIDDDVTLLALPMGAVLGAWQAVRTRQASALHRFLAICGASIATLATWMAMRFLRSSELAAGSGPLAGLGELMAAGMSIVLAVLGACMVGIWAFATLAKSGKARSS